MKVLVIGSGGREHSLVWKLQQSPRVSKIYCAPGNAGISKLAECLPLSATDVKGLVRFARKEGIDLTLVGPEASLTLGVVDAFEKRGLRIFGPTMKAAVLEGSKVFTKKFMQDYDIPTAGFTVFRKRERAIAHVQRTGAPVVIKADGLAAGKGVIVARTVAEAVDAIDVIMKDKVFGDAGNRVVVEEFMDGEEASFLAFTDGKTVLPLPTSQDHKPIFDNDKGPNTGGMGAYSPAPVVTAALEKQVMEKIMIPTVMGMAKEGRPYKGVLYAGLMIKEGRARVVEFNCRFGDPEAQPLLMRLKSDLVDVVEAVLDGTLDKIRLDIDPRPTVCVVMASGGYPGPYEKGKIIRGLPKAAKQDSVMVFHAGTALKNKKTVTAGGRVLGVTSIGKDLDDAISKAYETAAMINWPGSFYRTDIGAKAARHMKKAGAAETDGPRVGIVMGSDSDLPVMQAAADFLASMGISHEISVNSAHRTPDAASDYARNALDRGLQVIIAGAGMAAHLAGVLAAHTNIPVIGVPLDASPLNGLDALLSTVQMPPGVPVATMGIGKAGAKNGAVFAARILALHDPELAARLAAFKEEMVSQVEEKNRKLQGR
ncbi:MAG: phosphoribosylamine--glycine ligase [Deltaproteobacteria bacterium]|jgi:phosphoribosylamine--glycine ligase|nr:phosphoribosylamine--glycine ligase [Deltaproteobacteria bacterium]